MSAIACWMALASSATAAPHTFEALEARLSDALASYDRTVLDALWDDQLVFVFPNGALSRKAARLKAQSPPVDRGGPKLVATNDDVKVEYEDPHMAIVIVSSTWRFGGQPPERFLATHVWIKRRETWRLISAQVAEVAATQPSP